jgi:hypothetical protein
VDIYPRCLLLATSIIIHMAKVGRWHFATWPGATWQFFFPPPNPSKKKKKNHKIYFTQKYHKNIKTTFEIYHEHKIKLHKSIIKNVFVNYTNQHNNIYKSEDHVLINVFVINKTKLHRISTNLKTISRITSSRTRRVFANRRLLRKGWCSGVPTGECWLSCHPIGDNGPIVVALPASNENN